MKEASLLSGLEKILRKESDLSVSIKKAVSLILLNDYPISEIESVDVPPTWFDLSPLSDEDWVEMRMHFAGPLLDNEQQLREVVIDLYDQLEVQ
jgi:hypothetical protein